MGFFSPKFHTPERGLRDDADGLEPPAESGHGLATSDPAGLPDIADLHEPVDVRSAPSGREWRIRNAVLAILGGIVGVLLHPVRTVDVEGSVFATSVDLVTTDTPILSLRALVGALGAQGYTSVNGKPGFGRGSLIALPAAGGLIELEQISIPAGAQLTVSQEPIGGLNLRIAPGKERGKVRFNLPAGGYVLAGGDTITVEPGAPVKVEFDTLHFNLWLAPHSRPLDLLSQLSVRDLAFIETIVGADGLREDRRTLSTIRGGTLTFTESGTEIPLRPGERLEMRLQKARVHQVRSDTGGLVVTFRARASHLALGEEGMQRTLKPSRLARLNAHPLVPLLYAAFAAASLVAPFIIHRIK